MSAKYLSFSIFIILIVCSCKEMVPKVESKPIPHTTELTGEALAHIHCASCHQFVPPDKLSKTIWKEDVLPAMAQRLGIYSNGILNDSLFGSPENAQIVKAAQIYPESPVISHEDWLKLENFYLKNAPDELQKTTYNENIVLGLKQFNYKEVKVAHRPPMTTMVKIRKEGIGLIFSDGKPNSNVLTFLDKNLELEKNMLTFQTPIHLEEKEDMSYLLSVGKNIFPNDFKNGRLQAYTNPSAAHEKIKLTSELDNLQRPVHIAFGDMNGNREEDLVVCEYGDHTGQLTLYEKGDDAYNRTVLKQESGAIKSVVADVNQDGRLDIICLMAQGDEGIFYLENLGLGNFKEKRWMQFSPLNGSQNFEFIDFNGDGFKDILYTCGDNADKTPILKDYHGVYLFLNDGQMNFEQAYFFRMNGAYKTISLDFDNDGDLDMAAISFFPDYAERPEESFVYFENQGDLNFKAQSFKNASNGRWLVMDAGDIDGDGDIDLALGSFVYFLAKDDATGLSKRWLKRSPSVAILENTLVP
ncbi:FG-GAP repeat domain-containing protein [Euzebyella saccharophila]|uniref:FG-GAP repeat domain-containing protein n=1 Tax=Euzebyella saccharophila TaxID=679664 RepID=A0ABV8JJ90_9FLAO|nr:VCBS repeat-containing protein [Euzebyella saccharophila]